MWDDELMKEMKERATMSIAFSLVVPEQNADVILYPPIPQKQSFRD